MVLRCFRGWPVRRAVTGHEPSRGTSFSISFWLFYTEEAARAAEATFNMLRDMPDAPATFISVDVCEVIGQA
jgi:hypothetical protein